MMRRQSQRSVGERWPAQRPGPARLVRFSGYALVGAAALLVVSDFASATAGSQKVQVGVPILGCVLTIYILAFAGVTARGHAALAHAVAIGASCGVAAAVVGLVPVLVRPPLPASNGQALAAMVIAAGAALVICLVRGGKGEQGVMAALVAAAVAALVLFVSAEVLLQFFPDWVPDTSPANVPAADRLANNRAGAEDPYFAVLLLGCLTAAASIAMVLTTGRARPSTRVSREP